MPGQQINIAQADALSTKLRPMLGYLNRLISRMEKAGFMPGDPLLAKVVDARNSMHDLTVNVHYASCPWGRRGEQTVGTGNLVRGKK